MEENININVDKIENEAIQKGIDRILGNLKLDRKLRKGEKVLKNKQQQDVLRKYAEYCKLEGQSIKTIISKLRLLKYFCISIKDKELKKVTRKDIENFLISKSNKTIGTINNYKINLKSFYSWLYRKTKGQYPTIVSWIKPSKEKSNGEVEILTRNEIKLILKHANNLRDRCLISLLYDGGLRVGEAVNLKIKDCKEDSYGIVIKVNGKTGPRKVRLVESVPILKQWLNQHPFKNDDNYPLFICFERRYGYPLMVPGMYKIIEKVAKKAKINKKIYPHLLRHTKLTHLGQEGFTEMDLRIFAGWGRSSPMAETYLHTKEADVDRKIRGQNGLVDEDEEKRLKEEKEKLKPKECHMCNEKNDINNKFCFKCGQVLDVKTAMDLEKTRNSMINVIDDNSKQKIIEDLKKELLNDLRQEVAVKVK